MINRELFDKTREICGAIFTGEVTDELIKMYQNKLNVMFPKSYVAFLKEFGEGGISGTYIFGIDDDYYASVLEETKKFRKKEGIPEYYIVVQNCSTIEEEWLICLDTSRMLDGECPAIKYIIGTGKVTEYAKDFDEVFDKLVEERYLEKLEGIVNKQADKK